VDDIFANYADLAKTKKLGVDYNIVIKAGVRKKLAIVAPHAGKIEKGTSKIATKLAGDDFCLYLFEGIMPRRNRVLHITSHNFDEPSALQLVGSCLTAIGVHGRCDAGDKRTIYLGGLDKEFIKLIETNLNKVGFRTQVNGHKFPAKDPKNICNRGKSGKGAQIELPNTLRQRIISEDFSRHILIKAMRDAINSRFQLCTEKHGEN